MKTILKNIFALILILALFTACSKYEDGPWISFNNAKSRIKGEYYVEYFSVGGTDITQVWNDSCNWTFKLYDDEETREVETILYYSGNIYKNGTWHNVSYFGVYSLIDDNKSVRFDMNGYYENGTYYDDQVGIFPLSTGATHTFTIIRLTYDELWLRFGTGSESYEIHLKE